MNWIYLNKNNEDQYIEMFAQGSQCHTTQLETWNYEDSNDPIVLRGIMKHKIFKRCWQDNRPFRYMDTGYFGNRANFRNPHGVKMWHRIVDNNLQHGKIIPRPDDRWKQFNIDIKARRRGSGIVIVMPEDKPCIVYGTTAQQWLDET